MKKAIGLSAVFMTLVALLVLPLAESQERHPDISGEWFSNRGNRYLIEQRGSEFRLLDLAREREATGRIEGERFWATVEPGGKELVGVILEFGPDGRGNLLKLSEGLVLTRSPAPRAEVERGRTEPLPEIRRDLETLSHGVQTPQSPMTVEQDTDRPGANLRVFNLDTADLQLCVKACGDEPKCRAYTYVRPGVQGSLARCWFKTGVPSAKPNKCCVSGVKTVQGGEAPPTKVPVFEGRPLAKGPMTMEQDTDRPGANLRVFDLDFNNPLQCSEACQEDAQCRAYTYVKPGVQGPKARCRIKSGVPSAKPNKCCVSGVKQALAGTPAGDEPSGRGEEVAPWAGGEPGQPEPLPEGRGGTPDISGRWGSSIRRNYEIVQHGKKFTWTVLGTDEKAAGVIHADRIFVEWSGGSGSGHAEGNITERDHSGRAVRIEWSNGVKFIRVASEKKSSEVPTTEASRRMDVAVELPKAEMASPEPLMIVIPHLSLQTTFDQWVKVGGPIGGLGYDVRYLANDLRGRKTMFVTDNYSGVNKSLDGGDNWFASNNGIDARSGVSLDAVPVFSLTVDPNNPNIVWAGLKDVKGVYKSTDAGKTWKSHTPNILEKEFVFRGFTVMPGDSNTVFAAGELPTSIQGKGFRKVKGRIYLTRDGGASWEKVWEGDDLVRYVIVDPDNHKRVYASCGIFDREAYNSNCKSPSLDSPNLGASLADRGGVGVLRSDDGGRTWRVLGRRNGLTDLYVGSLVMHPKNPRVLLAGCGNNAASYYPSGKKMIATGGVFLTTDGGNTWVQTLNNDVINSVEFSPSRPNIAYAGGRQRFYRSEDGGQTWNIVSGNGYPWGPPGVIAGFPIDILVDPEDPNTLFANNYGGGNVKSTDGGKTWTIASRGYTGALMFDLSLHPKNPDIVFASARSGLFRTMNGGLDWKGVSSPPARFPEAYSVAMSPHTPQIVLASQELGGTVYRSRDNGKTWQQVFRLPVNPKDPLDMHGFKRIVFAPSAPNVVYGGACRGSNKLDSHPKSFGIYRSDQGGNAGSWKEANDPQTQHKSVNDLAVHPKNHNIVYAATVGGLFKTTDGGGSWKALGNLGNADVRAVALDPSDFKTVYAGIQKGGVFRSSDGGATWHKMSVGMNPNESVWALVVDPANPQFVWAGTRHSGVFRWNPIEQQWIKVNKGLSTKAVVDLEISNNGMVLYAATTGEGVFRYRKRP